MTQITNLLTPLLKWLDISSPNVGEGGFFDLIYNQILIEQY